MKILFYRYVSICEPDILEVFRKLDIELKGKKGRGGG